MIIKIKEFSQQPKIKEFPKKIKEFPNKIKEFSKPNKLKVNKNNFLLFHNMKPLE